MKQYLRIVGVRAKKNPKRIIFNEGEDDRILKAVKAICRKGIARPILLGRRSMLERRAKRFGIPLSKVDIVDPANIPKEDWARYINEFVAIRKKKGMTPRKAKTLLKDTNYLGCMMVLCGNADGMVSGAIGTTASLLRPAIQILRKKGKLVSSFFFMKRKGNYFLFADPSVNIQPTPKDLAQIAIETADTAKKIFKITPRVAMLSFSTHGSTDHVLAKNIRLATTLARRKAPHLQIDGEIQADAALMHDIYKRKCNECILRDRANVLIFPDLSSANIAYKLVQWLANYEAVGPITQGLLAPVNDLSRGCTVQDIIDLTSITVVQAQYHEKKRKRTSHK